MIAQLVIQGLALPMVANLSGITVALFATCINDVMFPGTPKAVVQVLSLIHI